MNTAQDRLRAGCNWGLARGRCGATPTHLYPVGRRCSSHTPNHHLKTDTEQQGPKP